MDLPHLSVPYVDTHLEEVMKLMKKEIPEFSFLTLVSKNYGFLLLILGSVCTELEWKKRKMSVKKLEYKYYNKIISFVPPDFWKLITKLKVQRWVFYSSFCPQMDIGYLHLGCFPAAQKFWLLLCYLLGNSINISGSMKGKKRSIKIEKQVHCYGFSSWWKTCLTFELQSWILYPVMVTINPCSLAYAFQ